MSPRAVVKNALLFGISITLLALLLLALLTSTKTGSTWLIKIANNLLQKNYPALHIVPGEPRALVKGINLAAFAWQNDSTHIEGQMLDIRLSLFCLDSVTICIEQLGIEQLIVTATNSNKPSEATLATPIKLPELNAPVPVLVKNIHIARFDYRTTQATPWLTHISWQAAGLRWKDSQLDITTSNIGNDYWQHGLSGKVELRGDYRLQFDQDIQISAPGLPNVIRARLALTQSLVDMHTKLNFIEPQAVEIEATVKPLLKNLPLATTLRAAIFSPHRWINTAQNFDALDVDVAVQGDLDRLAFTITSLLQNTRANGEQHLPLQASGWANTKQLQVERFAMGGRDSQLALSGNLSWLPTLQGRLAMTMASFNPNSVLQTPLSQLDGKAHVSFNIDTEQSLYSIAADLQQMRFKLGNIPVSANGSISTDDQQFVNIRDLSLASRRNTLHLQAKLAPPGKSTFANLANSLDWLAKSSFSAQLDADDLAELHPSYTGIIDLQLEHAANQPLLVSGEGRNLGAQAFAIKQLAVDANIMPDLRSTRSNTLALLASEARAAGGTWESLQFEASGHASKHKVSLTGRGPNIGFNALLDGSYTHSLKRWHGTLARLDATTQYQGAGNVLRLDAPLAIDVQQGQTPLQLAAFCLLIDAGKLCSEQSHYKNNTLHIGFSLEGFDFASLQPALPATMSWQGKLAGRGLLQQRAGMPVDVELSLQGSPGKILSNGAATPLQLDYESLELQGNISAQGFSTRLVMANQQGVFADASLNLSGRNFATLASDVRVRNFPLGILAPLVPAAEIAQAQLDLNLQASGTTSEPVLSGDILLRDGSFKLKRNVSYLSDIQLQGNFDKQLLDLRGTFRAGEGSGGIAGQLNFGEPKQGQLKLYGQRLQIESRPLLNLWADFDVTASLFKNELAITGEVAIPEGKIEVRQLPRSAQALSRDVIFAESNDEKQKPETTLQITTNLELALGPKLAFNGFDASANLAGRLKLTQKVGKPLSGSGEVNIVNGKYRGYGQKLDVRRGRLLFNGPLDSPDIDIEAVRQVSDATVGIQVSGPALEAELTPFAEPSLPDDEIIFRLVTGRVPGSKTTTSENQLIAQALVSSGIKFGGASIAESAEKLGIQNFNVGTGDESDLLLSGYLDPSLYLEYGVNALGDGSTFKVRWDFARRMSLELIGGLQSSLDLLYTREF